MALRAFHSNPSLGGFGGENDAPMPDDRDSDDDDDNSHDDADDDGQLPSSSDAFAQIVKELVDNAVDACLMVNANVSTGKVRVSIVDGPNEDTFRVTVQDNGCGMKSITDCVGAFSSNKTTQTAGRYGIGLTLCLVHAQRLVPGSTTTIVSATKEAGVFLEAEFVVDTEQDIIRCVNRRHHDKSTRDESGTTVSLLLPGGPTAVNTWPRLAEYFARFQLNRNLCCTLEVLAPKLSSVPLHVRSFVDRKTRIPNGNSEPSASARLSEPSVTNKARSEVHAAVSAFLKKNVNLKQVATSKRHIRTKRGRVDHPTLEASIIICGPSTDEDTSGGSTSPEVGSYPVFSRLDDREDTSFDELRSETARMTLIRMVNNVPLLDGAESAACGLVHGLAAKHHLWSSYGLSLSMSSNDGSDGHSMMTGSPVFAVDDNETMRPFLRGQSNVHRQIDSQSDDEDDDDSDYSARNDRTALVNRWGCTGNKKRANSARSKQATLPAHLRLGDILMIVQIQAEPSALPLPTLSKGRIPMNNHYIDLALELAVGDCLCQLQSANPGLLLTPHQLRQTMRDLRYIPAVSSAVGSIVRNSNNSDLLDLYGSMRDWKLCAEPSNSNNPAVVGRGNKEWRYHMGDSTIDNRSVLKELLRNVCRHHNRQSENRKTKLQVADETKDDTETQSRTEQIVTRSAKRIKGAESPRIPNLVAASDSSTDDDDQESNELFFSASCANASTTSNGENGVEVGSEQQPNNDKASNDDADDDDWW